MKAAAFLAALAFVAPAWATGAQAPNAGVNWYFKNGTYGTSNHSKSNHRNIRTWRNLGGTGLRPPEAVPRLLASRHPGRPGRLELFDAKGALVAPGLPKGGRPAALAAFARP